MDLTQLYYQMAQTVPRGVEQEGKRIIEDTINTFGKIMIYTGVGIFFAIVGYGIIRGTIDFIKTRKISKGIDDSVS